MKVVTKSGSCLNMERARKLALHRAELIQERKDIERQNLHSIENLIDLPSAGAEDSGDPSAEDACQVCDGMRLFTTADLDAVVEERNVDNKCGYVLCPKSSKANSRSSKLHYLKEDGLKSAKVVEAGNLGQWCSAECKKRTLYLKLQLSDTPAWERAGESNTALHLYGEAPSKGGGSTAEVQVLVKDLRQLALEREDSELGSSRLDMLDIQVQEKA